MNATACSDDAEEPGMVVRIWTARASAEKEAAYVSHATASVFPALKALPGHWGAYVLQRETEDGVELVVAMVWESMDAVKRFAGDRLHRAVVDPGFTAQQAVDAVDARGASLAPRRDRKNSEQSDEELHRKPP